MRSNHGGQLHRAAHHYGIAVEHWLDLSTGINPSAWQVPEVPPQVWQRLPEDEDGLLAAAARYYGVQDKYLTALAGSQAAIQTLPQLVAPGPVVLPEPSFNEHALAWQKAGHQVLSTAPDVDAVDARIAQDDCRYAVVVNPNNPTGHCYNPTQLEQWRQTLWARGGLLVVDEAFVDPTPQASVLQVEQKPGLVVLRSVGKFFGLAGLRLGFAVADQAITDPLKDALGPWPVSHPARFLGQQLLLDREWQRATRQQLQSKQQRLHQMLRAAVADHKPLAIGDCALFQSLHIPRHAHALFEYLAKKAILVRLFEQSGWLRFGLPADEAAWQRLQDALLDYSRDQRP